MPLVWKNGEAVNLTDEEAQIAVKTPADLETEVQRLADELTQTDERLMALALATVDLRMADVSGLTAAQVRQQFRDRVVFYLRQRRGL